MKLGKWVKQLICLSTFALGLIGCSQQHEASNELRVGTIAGPETELMQTAKQVAANRYDLKIKIVEFTDYNMPNEALADGSIDANMFQHLPYLQAAMKAKGYALLPIAKTFVYPMGIYSKKITNLQNVKDGALVAVPNDTSNEERSLLLLQKANLIQLKPDANITATVADIASNPKNLVFKEIDAAQLPRVLPDVDLAAINTNYAMLAGLVPSKDALAIEDANSPYANLVVIKETDKNDPRLLKLIAALNSAEVVQEAQKLFHGQAIPAWPQNN